MIRYRASWVVPIAGRPVRNGSVTVDGGRIVAVGVDGDHGGSLVDLGSVALMPGLVNAHTHLELSYLRGRVPPAPSFVTWVRRVMAARALHSQVDDAEVLAGVEEGIAEALGSGTALVGDISNTLVTFEPLARSQLAGLVWYELIRFLAPDPVGMVAQACERIEGLDQTGLVRASLAAHAPYSVAPSVFRAISDRARARPFGPWSVHLSESAEEVEFIRTGGGPWRVLLEELGAWDAAWTAPGVSPVEYLDAEGALDSLALAVHGVQMPEVDMARIRERGVTVVTCPRSNAHTGAGVPPIAAFYRSGVPVAVGTDSLASVEDLNVFAELAAMRAIAPAVPASALLDSATRQGARALGFGPDLGTLETGKLARFIAVDLPGDAGDVEEYLVSGIRPEQVRWVA